MIVVTEILKTKYDGVEVRKPMLFDDKANAEEYVLKKMRELDANWKNSDCHLDDDDFIRVAFVFHKDDTIQWNVFEVNLNKGEKR